MNAPHPAPETLADAGQRHYICRRVVDALLREDVREIVSRGRIVAAAAASLPEGAPQPSHWLAVEHLGDGCLWIPLRPCLFMQDWALHGLPLLRQEGEQWRRLDDAATVLALIGQGLDPDTAALFADYAGECRTAAEHAALCGAERRRHFAEVQRSGRRADLGPRWEERLLLKDNDACRIHGARLAAHWPALAGFVDALQDRRIVVDEELPLAQMFTTITLQLNVAVLAEGLASLGLAGRRQLYGVVRDKIAALLAELARSGEDTGLARRVLLEDGRQYVKYLLTAASLKPKAATGAGDVNKFYGQSAPNFLKERP